MGLLACAGQRRPLENARVSPHALALELTKRIAALGSLLVGGASRAWLHRSPERYVYAHVRWASAPLRIEWDYWEPV
mgnify:CR=1 FL=1